MPRLAPVTMATGFMMIYLNSFYCEKTHRQNHLIMQNIVRSDLSLYTIALALPEADYRR
jgi:hypothetical protein